MAQTTPQTSEDIHKAQANQCPHEACLEVKIRATIKISQDELQTPVGRAPLSNDLFLSAIANTMGWPHKSYLQKTSTGQTLTLFAYSNVTPFIRGKTKHFFFFSQKCQHGWIRKDNSEVLLDNNYLWHLSAVYLMNGKRIFFNF